MLHFSPTPKNLSFFFILLSLPLLLLCCHYLSEHSKLNRLEKRLDRTSALLSKEHAKIQTNRAVKRTHQISPTQNVSEEGSPLEQLTFLQSEIKHLKNSVENPSPPLHQRLEFLLGERNKISFLEKSLQTSPSFKETVESTQHPVEIDLSDLYQVLTTIENSNIQGHPAPPHRPQTFFLEFKLERKQFSNKNEVFLLDMQVLKREYF